jgi:hypothetical protein
MTDWIDEHCNDDIQRELDFYVSLLGFIDNYQSCKGEEKLVCIVVEGSSDEDFFNQFCQLVPQPKKSFFVGVPQKYPKHFCYPSPFCGGPSIPKDLDVCIFCKASLSFTKKLICLEVFGIIDKDFCSIEDDKSYEFPNVLHTDTNDLETEIMATNPACLFSAIQKEDRPVLALAKIKALYQKKIEESATSAYRLGLLNQLRRDLDGDSSWLPFFRPFNSKKFFATARETYIENTTPQDCSLVHDWVSAGLSSFTSSVPGSENTIFSGEEIKNLEDEIRELLTHHKRYPYGLDARGVWKKPPYSLSALISGTLPLSDRLEFWSHCRGHSFIQFLKNSCPKIAAEFPSQSGSGPDRALEFAMIHSFDMGQNWETFSATELGKQLQCVLLSS